MTAARARQHADIPTGRKPQRDVTAELIATLENRVIKAVEEAESKAKRDRLVARWHHKAGTPETHQNIEIIPSRRRQHPLERMYQQGTITLEDLAASQQIQSVVETLSRAASIRLGSLEMRVDYSASARDVLVESLARIRLEVTYSLWRKALPQPAGLILQMICSTYSYVAAAKHYSVDFRTARKLLITSLRDWQSIWADTCKTLDREDVNYVYARLGAGALR